jgi:hypothetical protein
MPVLIAANVAMSTGMETTWAWYSLLASTVSVGAWAWS